MIRPATPSDAGFADLLAGSYERLVGCPLFEDPPGGRLDALWLYDEAPLSLLAHDTQPDPLFIYANRTAQTCFGYGWEEIRTLPSRLSAEPGAREDRMKLLEAVTTNGYVSGYSGIRIAKSGRRFRIEDATIWTLIDATGARHGQAAAFARWSWCEKIDPS